MEFWCNSRCADQTRTGSALELVRHHLDVTMRSLRLNPLLLIETRYSELLKDHTLVKYSMMYAAMNTYVYTINFSNNDGNASQGMSVHVYVLSSLAYLHRIDGPPTACTPAHTHTCSSLQCWCRSGHTREFPTCIHQCL